MAFSQWVVWCKNRINFNFFYNNFQYVYPFSQVTTLGGGNGANFNEMGPTSSQYIYKELFPQTLDARYRIDQMSAEDKANYQAIWAMTLIR